MSAVQYIKRENGESYPVRYDVNALCHFEEISGGKSLINGTDGFDVRCIRALIFVGLYCGHEFTKQEFKLTPLDIGRWEDLIKTVFPQCSKILKDMSGKQKEGEEAKPGE